MVREAGEQTPTLAVVIPTHNRHKKLRRLLISLADSTLVANRTIVVADQCTDETGVMLRRDFPEVELVESETPAYCSGGRALGLARTAEQYVFFVDDDNIVDRSCLSELVAIMQAHPKIGLLGPLMMWFPPDSGVWCAGGEFTHTGVRYRRDVASPSLKSLDRPLSRCDFLPNAFLARKALLANQVPLDPALFPHNWAEADLGARMVEAGYEVHVAHRARVWHDPGYSGRTTRLGRWEVEDQARSRLLFRRRFPGLCGSLLRFWLVTFPVSTLYYAGSFASAGHFTAFAAAYVRGTVQGARMPLPAFPACTSAKEHPGSDRHEPQVDAK